jgi:hypothetical protein
VGYGIGGGGFLGVALEQLLPPVQAAATSSTTGGTLPATSAYKYVLTSTNAAGETTVSNEVTITTGAGATNSNTVNWAAVTGATGYKLYRTAAAGGPGTELLLTAIAGGATITYLDTGALTPAGAQPTVNTALASGVYTPPVKYFPITSESLKYVQSTQWRRPIRQSVDNIGGVPGDVHTEGDIVIEGLTDAMIYFHRAARAACVKTGPVTAKYTYTFTPSAVATPGRTLSITVVRNGVVFGYTGCVVGTVKFNIANGMLVATYSITGSDETVQALPTPVWNTNQLQPFGAGEYDVEIPTGTQVFDTDTFDFTSTDNATPNYRLKNTGRGAQFISFKERTVTMTLNRDFQDRTDYDAFKALTAQALRVKAVKAVTAEVFQLDLQAAVKDTFEAANLSAQGDLLTSKIAYQGTLDQASGNAWTLQIVTGENMIP